MAIPESTTGKSELRKTMRQQLRGRELSSGKPCGELVRWLATQPALRTVATFSALLGEVDLSAAVRQRPDLRWVYPKIGGDHLTFHQAENWVLGPFGILEPADGSPEIPVYEIDAFICPGLAFDIHGGRLGRGRGFYDRVLAQANPAAHKIGICHGFQIVPETFSESHDIPMDAVIW